MPLRQPQLSSTYFSSRWRCWQMSGIDMIMCFFTASCHWWTLKALNKSFRAVCIHQVQVGMILKHFAILHEEKKEGEKGVIEAKKPLHWSNIRKHYPNSMGSVQLWENLLLHFLFLTDWILGCCTITAIAIELFISYSGMLFVLAYQDYI